MTPHRLDSDYVRDQLRLRIVPANDRRRVPEGEFVLYWMQAAHRLDENWALRYAVLEADRFNVPLVIHQGLDPSYPHASDRHHAFILEGARETAARAEALGLHYQFVLRRRRADDRRVVDRLAARAVSVVTDYYPTAGVRERVARFAERSPCRVIQVDATCIAPSLMFEKPEWAARTIRPKLARVRDHLLEPVADRGPRRPVTATLAASLLATIAESDGTRPLDLAGLDDAALDAELARCEIDHEVPRVRHLRGGRATALARLARFVDGTLPDYARRRQEASDAEGSSRLSPWLHFGHVGGAEVLRAALASGAPADQVAAFADQVLTWRELGFNFARHAPRHDVIEALPAWAQRTLAEHEGDPREADYDLATLEAGRTDHPLWNAAQQELRRDGTIHNYARMLWGKSVLLWTRTPQQALSHLLHMNDRWALDGRDPNSVGGVLWCLGLWDRPWGNRPVWGGIRPMSLARAKGKFDVEAYVRRFAAPGSPVLPLGG